MAESLQRILYRRGLEGQHPTDTAHIISRFKATTRHSDAAPTPFVWGWERATRRRKRKRHHRLGGSGADF